MNSNINQTITDILKRTCCRTFMDKEISEEIIKILIDCAQTAPSAKNRQPWFFLVLKNKKIKKKIAQLTLIGRYCQFANLDNIKKQKMIQGNAFNNSNDSIICNAPIAILVIRASTQDYREALTNELNIKEEQGVACAAYSILLAAQSLGLGSAWLCSPLYIKKELKILFKKYQIKWQKNWEPRAIIPIGYCKKPLYKPQRKSINAIYKII